MNKYFIKIDCFNNKIILKHQKSSIYIDFEEELEVWADGFMEDEHEMSPITNVKTINFDELFQPFFVLENTHLLVWVPSKIASYYNKNTIKSKILDLVKQNIRISKK